MNRHKFYLLTIFIGVICAAFFIYNKYEPLSHAAPVSSGQENIIQSFPDPNHTSYRMGLYLDTASSTLYGKTLLATRNTTGIALKELWFTAYPNAFKNPGQSPVPANAYYSGYDPGWMKIDQLKVNGQETNYIEQGVSINANLPTEILPNTDISIEVKWQARIPRVAYRYGSKNGVYMLGNFYPALNVYTTDGWHNSYNSVFGDPFCFNCADYLVTMNIPENYGLVSTGDNVETIAEDNGRETHVIRAKNARDFCMVVMYDYTQEKAKIAYTDVKCYAPAGNLSREHEILEQSRQILNYYACTFGSYPYQEFKVVFVPMQGFHGMEYSGLIFLQEEFLQPDYNKEKSLFILAHEIAHQWWYSQVGNDQLREPWLDEGLANWSAYKYLQDMQGKKPPAVKQFPNGVNLGRELREIYSTREYYQTAYTGGEEFWFGLEEELGPEKVIKVLRRYLADYQYKIATTDNLQHVIKTEAHKDMQNYFYKWFKQ
ncbi:MAG: M1 family metallopeptidase [Syntrophomonas sp.]